jgi:hypothetical protein
MSGLPVAFNSEDVLDPGTYDMTFSDLKSSLLVRGDGSSSNWDSAWRGKLVDNLEILTEQLWSVGFKEIFINGSFVENKDRPNDIDGYFDTKILEITSTEMKRYEKQIFQLNTIAPFKVWNWDPNFRVFDPRTGKAQLPMWIKYRIELYPHMEGMFSGIKDKLGNNMMFPSAFRQSRRNFIPKGIVRIIS